MAASRLVRPIGWLPGLLALAAGAATAQDLPGDPDAGARLADQVCATCHLVGDAQTSDPEVGPSFFEIADHPATTEMSLRAFLQTSHATMPNLILTPEETDDIISYILTLKGQ